MDVSVINTFFSNHTGQLTSLKIPKITGLVSIINFRQMTDDNLTLLNSLLKLESWSIEETYNKFVISNPDLKDMNNNMRQEKKGHLNFDGETRLKWSQFLEAQEGYIRNRIEESKLKGKGKRKYMTNT